MNNAQIKLINIFVNSPFIETIDVSEEDASIYRDYISTGNEMTQSDLADKYGYSVTKIGHAISNTGRRIRHRIVRGVQETQDLDKLREQAETYKKRYEDLKNRDLQLDDITIHDMNLSNRVFNSLMYGSRIRKLSDFKDYTRSDLLDIRGFGEESMKEVERVLKRYEIYLD